MKLSSLPKVSIKQLTIKLHCILRGFLIKRKRKEGSINLSNQLTIKIYLNAPFSRILKNLDISKLVLMKLGKNYMIKIESKMKKSLRSLSMKEKERSSMNLLSAPLFLK